MLPFGPARARPRTPRRAPARMLAAALGAALLTGAGATLLPASGAHAAERTVSGGRLDWAVKSSFQSYVTGPIAQGSWSLTDGAATVGASRFRFHSATGGYDPDTGDLTAAFSGGVHFTGHRTPDGSHQLDLTISRPEVVLSGGRGTLYADMTSKAKGTGKVTTRPRVPLATLGVGGLDTRGGTTPIALRDLPAKLTAQGAAAFAGYYTAGTPLDPVSLSADVRAKDVKGAASGSPEPAKSPKGNGAKGAGDGDGAFTEAAVDWGVRRTFREYVTGSLVRGRWKLTGGAQDGGALFRFPHGKGRYDAAKHRLDAEFDGTLRFTGRHLHLALGAVTVTVRDGKGTLAADVTTRGGDGKGAAETTRATPLVTFDAGQPTPKGGLLVVKEAPARLTAAGAKSFGGMYTAGAAMDPVSLAVAVEGGAALPALPDLGSDPKAAKPAAERDAYPEPAASSSPAVLPLSLAGAAVVVAAAAVLLVRRARRRTPAATTPPTPQD